MNIFNFPKKILIKIDDFREEKLEDFIADSILAKLDNNSTVDELERKAVIVAITAANAYAATYGVPNCPDEIKEKIADVTVKILDKANKKLQKQLKKKSKRYTQRHENEL